MESPVPQSGASRRGAYGRLAQVDADHGGNINLVEDSRRARRESIERLSNKMHALFWVVVAIVVFHYGRVFDAAFYDNRTLSWMVYLGLGCITAVLAIMVYLTVYVPRIRGIRDIDWQVYDPRAIPTATGFGVGSVLCFLIGMWPVYGLLTPAILALLYMGSLMSLHFIPFC